MDLNDSLGSMQSALATPPTPTSSLSVCAGHGLYRSATDEEILSSARKILASRVSTRPAVNSTSDARTLLQMEIGSLEHEVFVVMFLDAQHRLIEMRKMFRGTASQTSVYPREVVKEALALNACALLLAHNHPSGHCEPSRADENLTQTLKSACSLVDIRVLDHVIVSMAGSCSMAERGLM